MSHSAALKAAISAIKKYIAEKYEPDVDPLGPDGCWDFTRELENFLEIGPLSPLPELRNLLVEEAVLVTTIAVQEYFGLEYAMQAASLKTVEQPDLDMS